MTLPNLGNIFGSEEQKIYLALKIEANEVKSAVWELIGGKTQILAVGERQDWGETKEELMAACDASIAGAVAKMPSGNQEIPRQLIFGLPSFWTVGDKIKPEKLVDLQFITKKLTLSPLGFIVVPEAITHLLKNKEKEAISTVLIYLGQKEIHVSLVINDKLVQSEVVERSDNLALDVEEGIWRFSTDNLPPRILLYNGENTEVARQTLISYPWQPPAEKGKPGFLHLPRVEVLPADFDLQAVVFAGGEELSGKKLIPSDLEVKEKKEEMPPVEPIKKEENLPLDEVEFFNGEDVLTKTELIGSFEDEDKELIQEETELKPEVKKESIVEEAFEEVKKEEKKESRKRIRSFFSSIRLPKFSLGRLVTLPVLIIIVFLVLIIAGFYFFAKAEVTLSLVPKIISKELKGSFDSRREKLLVAGEEIPVKELVTELSADRTIPVTGKKTVGEKAKGEVIIYNRTDNLKNLSAGTVLVGSGKLNFLLDNEVRVASKTPDLASGIDRWGEVKIGITAENIGAEYNLGANSQFTVADLSASQLLAKNQVAFLGGTSRQLTVVSSVDQEKLLTDLSNELNKKARDKLKDQTTSDRDLLWESFSSQIKSQKFDHEVQEEASTVRLDLTTSNRVLSFNKDDLVKTAVEMLVDEDIRGMTIETAMTQVKILSSDSATESGFRTEVKVFLKKNLDSDKLIGMIEGKQFIKAEELLRAVEPVSKIEIKISPGIFRIFSRMPFRKQNIFFNYNLGE